MILYFSGTGNSKYVAQRIASALGDELLSLNERIKAGDSSPVETGERLVLVTPTYAWRIPRVVRDWLQKTTLRGAKQAWFVMTCGSEIGNSASYNRALCAKKGLAYCGTAQLVMPENYIAMFSAPQPDEAREIVARAEPDIDRTIAALQEGRAFAAPCCSKLDRFLSSAANPVFYLCYVKARAFTVKNPCTGCGQCAKRCPMNNITIQNGKPVWGKHCTHCMACICYCPKEAIEFGKKSLGQPRYHFEAL